MSDLDFLRHTVEALLFVSGEGMSVSELARGTGESQENIRIAVDSLVDDYNERDGGIVVQEIAGRYRFTTQPKVYPAIQAFLRERKKESLSKAMLETLAIITYKQPITLYAIDEIRGVNSRSMITGLLNKKLIKSVGQKEAPGRPALYGTTKEFLDYFGLNSLEELPPPKDVKELNFEEL